MRAMNLLILHPHEWPAGTSEARLQLHDQRADHLRNVLQASVGDTVRIGVLNGLMGEALIEQIDHRGIHLLATLDKEPPAPLPLTLLLALPRPKVLRRLLLHCTTLGIKHIHLINSYRVEKSYWQTPFLQPQQVQQQFLLGLEQARDTVLPQLHQHTRFKPFVEDILPALAAGRRCITAHPMADSPPCPAGVSGETILAVGPEGGFIPYEVEKLAACGFSTVQLGPRILKVETAVPALVSKLFL